jgi:hypothetical protein
MKQNRQHNQHRDANMSVFLVTHEKASAPELNIGMEKEEYGPAGRARAEHEIRFIHA